MAKETVDRAVIRNLLDPVIPERKADLDALWAEIKPQFFLYGDTGKVCLQARGADVQFTNQTMRLFWLLGFAAWSAFCCYSPATLWGTRSRQRISGLLNQDEGYADSEAAFKTLLLAADILRGARSVDDFAWPADVPEPQPDKSGITNIQHQAAFDLTMVGTAYTILHELRHVWNYRHLPRPSDLAEEEIDCDVFARDFVLAKADLCAQQSRHAYEKVVGKRAMGIALGAFIVYEITPAYGRGGTSTHPPFADRLEALIKNMPVKADADFWVFTSTLLMAALRHKNRAVDETFDSPESLTLRLIEEIRRSP